MSIRSRTALLLFALIVSFRGEPIALGAGSDAGGKSNKPEIIESLGKMALNAKLHERDFESFRAIADALYERKVEKNALRFLLVAAKKKGLNGKLNDLQTSYILEKLVQDKNPAITETLVELAGQVDVKRQPKTRALLLKGLSMRPLEPGVESALNKAGDKPALADYQARKAELLKRIPSPAALYAVPNEGPLSDSRLGQPGGEYDEIKSISLSVLRECPPKDCVVIGIGRSPTPILAFLQDLHEEKLENHAINIPLSSFRFSTLPIPERYIMPLDDSSEKKLFAHFDSLLTDSSRFAGKRVMLVDYTQSGESLFSAQKYFEKYFRSREVNVDVEPLALVHKNNRDRVTARAKSFDVQTKMLDISRFERFNANMRLERYDKLSEYKRYKVTGPMPYWLDKPKRNKEYLSLKNSIMKRIREDRTLDDALGSISKVTPATTEGCSVLYGVL